MLASPQLLDSYRDMLDQVDDLARANHLRLDYSPGSINQIDELLTGLHQEYQDAHDNSDDMLESMHGLALILGAYVIETVERRHGSGTWRLNAPEAGEPDLPYDLPYTHSEQTIVPVEWCFNRLIDGGHAGSVTVAYQRFMDRLEEEARTAR